MTKKPKPIPRGKILVRFLKFAAIDLETDEMVDEGTQASVDRGRKIYFAEERKFKDDIGKLCKRHGWNVKMHTGVNVAYIYFFKGITQHAKWTLRTKDPLDIEVEEYV